MICVSWRLQRARRLPLLQYPWVQMHSWEGGTREASLATHTPNPTPTLPWKSNSLDRKSWKRTLKKCDRELEYGSGQPVASGGSVGGKDSVCLRGRSLGVWPCSSECIDDTDWACFIWILIFIFTFWGHKGWGRYGRTERWVWWGAWCQSPRDWKKAMFKKKKCLHAPISYTKILCFKSLANSVFP